MSQKSTFSSFSRDYARTLSEALRLSKSVISWYLSMDPLPYGLTTMELYSVGNRPLTLPDILSKEVGRMDLQTLDLYEMEATTTLLNIFLGRLQSHQAGKKTLHFGLGVLLSALAFYLHVVWLTFRPETRSYLYSRLDALNCLESLRKKFSMNLNLESLAALEPITEMLDYEGLWILMDSLIDFKQSNFSATTKPARNNV